MGRNGSIQNPRTEEPRGVKIHRRVGLYGHRAVGAVVAENTAIVEVSWGTNRHHHVGEEKNREGAGVDALRRQRRKDLVCHNTVEQEDVHNPHGSAKGRRTEGGSSQGETAGRRDIYGDRGESLNRTEPHMVASPIYHPPEVRPLEGIDSLCAAHIGAAIVEVRWLNNRRLLKQRNWNVVRRG